MILNLKEVTVLQLIGTEYEQEEPFIPTSVDMRIEIASNKRILNF